MKLIHDKTKTPLNLFKTMNKIIKNYIFKNILVKRQMIINGRNH
jgi:hypothetical protein